MRIALVHPYSWPEVRRGGERYLADLTEYLGGAGHRVDVITGSQNGRSRELVGSVATRRLKLREPEALRRRGISSMETFGALAVGPLLRRRYDVVHCFTPTAALAGRLAGQRTLYTVLGHPSPDLVASATPEIRLMRAAIRTASAVAALSAASVAAVEESFGRHAAVLPPGVVLDRFPVDLAPRTGPPRILFTSLAAPHKGLGVLLRAAALLLDRMPDLRVQIAGPGDPAWAFEALGDDASRVRAAVDVLGVGRIEDLPGLYRGATVTVLPSTHEAFGLVLVESLATGTPVVATAAGGMPEIVDRPEIGRTVPFDRPDALAEALAAVVELAREPATPGRCRAHAKRWGWTESIGPMHEELYRAVIARRKRRLPPARERASRSL